MRMDLIHIFRKVYDSAANALSVKLASNEFSIELNHRDGDSVTAHPEKLVVKVEGVNSADNNSVIVPPLDCSSLRELKIYIQGTGEAKIQVSPEDSGNFFVDYVSGPVVARRVRVVSINAEGNVHLVGRS